MSTNWQGVLPAITTPFDADLAIDHAFVTQHVRWLVDHGSKGIIPCGSLGEGATLSFEEKVALIRTCVAAVDGRDPGIVVSQVESATFFGLTAALWGEINIQGGRVQQTNFDRYRLLRLNEAPRVDTFIIESTEDPGGIGEPATALVAPAIGNAIFAATGRRVRSLPLSRHKLA